MKRTLSNALDGALRLLAHGKSIQNPAFYNHIVTSIYRGFIANNELPIFIKALKTTDIIAREDLIRKRIQELYDYQQSSRLRTSRHRKERKRYQASFKAKKDQILTLQRIVPYFWLRAFKGRETNLNYNETVKLIKALKHYHS